MKTMILKTDEQGVCEAVRVLKAGLPAAVPTETVYGLAADAYDEKAVAAVFEAKGRPQDNPLILHISDMDMLYSAAKSVPPLALRLAEKFWPGPLTMIFPRNEKVPASTCGGLDTAAVRMPKSEFLLDVISRCGFPIAAPSANTSGLPSPTSAKHVIEDMNGKIPLIIDGGSCEVGVESTVICFEGENAVRILRPGAVTKEMLSEYCTVSVDSGVTGKIPENKKVLSPGMKYKHYSPKAQVYILDKSFPDDKLFTLNSENEKTGFLGFGGEKLPEGIIMLPYGENAPEQAENLFSSLRQADDIGCSRVFVRMPDKSGIGLAVYNRLLRAAAFRIIGTEEELYAL